MKTFYFLIVLTLASLTIYAQKQANYWYFGENAGLNFGSGTPVAQTNGALSTMEGCSSISTSNGTLRFYTDGIKVWNKDHLQMPHGNGLLGNPSSSQSGIIVPRPASDNLYYIFTIDDVAHGNGGSYGINYSLVDMKLMNWKGDVVDTVKNVNLTTPMCEKVTAVGHANGFDTWVITQKWGTNNIYSYLITNEGINETPIISELGLVISGDIDNAKGYMKVSPNGEVLAKANAGMKNVEIFDFNNATGRASNARIITGILGEPYGIEFSPDNKLLYVNSWKNHGGKYLLQYDLEAGSIGDIIASQYIVATGTEGALQIAPDNRIYVAMNNSGSLSRINQPNKIGADCNFEYATVGLAGRTCRWGLPPFIQSFFSFNAGFYNDKPCLGVPTQFYENSSQEPDSVLWNFGDSGSGDDSTSTLNDPLHLFSKAALFNVQLTVWIEGIKISVNHLVVVAEKPPVDLGNDTTFCDGEFWQLDAGEGFDEYYWVTGDTTRWINVDTSGTYWVQVTLDENCTNADTVNITFTPNPTAYAGDNQLIESGTTTNLEGVAANGTPPYEYFWIPASELVQNDIPDPVTVPLFAPQNYTLFVNDANGCLALPSDVLVNVYEPGDALAAYPFANPDTICRGEQTNITANATGGSGIYEYSWTSEPPGFTSSDAEFNDTPQQTTTYKLVLSDSETTFINEEVTVVVNQLPVIDLIPEGAKVYAPDTIVVCVRDSVLLDAGFDTDPMETVYKWSPGNIYSRFNTIQTNGSWIDFQTYTAEVTNGETGCYNSGNITTIFDFNECAIGVEEKPDEQAVIAIRPNPNSGVFSLELSENMDNAELSVRNIRGQQIYYKQFNRLLLKGESILLNIDFPDKGIYFVVFKSNKKQFISKLMVR